VHPYTAFCHLDALRQSKNQPEACEDRINDDAVDNSAYAHPGIKKSVGRHFKTQRFIPAALKQDPAFIMPRVF